MEQITEISNRIATQPQTDSQQQPRSLANTQARQNLGVSGEQMAAMLTVLNKRWISQGWRAMDTADSEPMALVFIEALNRENVPYQHYGELFQRSIALRSSRLAAGLKCEDFSVDMMLACWPGLRDELRQREIDAGRTLPDTARSQCERCLGNESGMEFIYDDEGNAAGLRKNCDHRPIEEGEGIWIYMQNLKAAARPRVVG